MTDDERREAERLANTYEDHCEVDSERGYRASDIRAAFVAGRESLQSKLDQAELGRAFAIDEASRRLQEWNKCIGKINAEHARAEWLLSLIEHCDQELHRAIVTDDIGVGDLP